MRVLFIIALVVIGFWLLATGLFTVDRVEYVYLTQLGRPIATYDGATEAGLHFKWPWPFQTVQRLDHRLQVFDLPSAELLTHDARGQTIDKTLVVDAFVCWQIAGKEGVDRFVRTVGTPERAHAVLGQRVSSRLGAEIGNLPIEELISVADPAVVEQRLERLRQRLLLGEGQENLRDLARTAYGIELVDVGLRRFNHPAQVRDAIFDRIRSERNKKVADYQSEGAKLAEDIKSAAARQAQDILTTARSQEQRVRREADVRADEIRNQAQSRDRDFYAFLQKLENYQKLFSDSKDVLLLSSKHELFDLLLRPPRATAPSTDMSKGAMP